MLLKHCVFFPWQEMVCTNARLQTSSDKCALVFTLRHLNSPREEENEGAADLAERISSCGLVRLLLFPLSLFQLLLLLLLLLLLILTQRLLLLQLVRQHLDAEKHKVIYFTCVLFFVPLPNIFVCGARRLS